MLRNPRGATSLRWLKALLEAGIEVHGQVVVCPGVNDGAELVRTLEDVLTEYPGLASVSLVPLGVSDFSNEPDMRAHSADEARHVVELARFYAQLSTELLGRPLFYASDEYYLVAGLEAPSADELDSLDQAENGVGIVAAFSQSFETGSEMASLGTGFFQSVDGAPAWGYRAERVSASDVGDLHGAPTVLTGQYAAPILRALLDRNGFGAVEVVAVENRYFGGNIKVAGLLTGSDIARVVRELGPTRQYLLPDVCLSEDLFLDGTSIHDIDARITTIDTSGSALRRALESLTRDLVTS
jgi:NifB/MoaA-like Fe-S oxidoreductase